MKSFLSIVALSALVLQGANAALDPIVIKGSKFFFKTNGTQFFIKGVAYQSGISSNGTTSGTDAFVDPLADTTACQRDIPYLQKLGANAIRTYALNASSNHDVCMAALDAAGIYLISDLGEPATSINRADPVWDIDLYTRYTSVVDAMAKYDNVIGFFAGNEVTNNVSYTAASAFVKAAVRDTKAYIASKNYRAMGVGYAADDDATVRASVSSYLNCGDPSTSIDFWGYNIYEWCGDSTYQTSGYAARTAEFQNYNVPVFFAEYGCNTQPGGAATREFTEVAALYGTDMAPVFSGGIVYEYFEEVNDYGLVTIAADASVSTLADFNAWSTQIASVSPSSVQASAYTPTNSAQSCPTVDANWQVSPSGLPPTPNESVCNCEVSTLTCVASSSVTDEQIGDLFSQVCGYNSGKPCVGIATNTTTGTYGAFSMCTPAQKLSIAFNTYYAEQGTSDACNFAGAAQIIKAAGAASTCSSIIASATSANPGTSATGAAASSSTKKGDAASIQGASLGLGYWAFGAYAATAVLSGAGILWL